MEYFLAIAAGSTPARKERFAELGAALERAVGLLDAGEATPLELTDTGERRLLGQADMERLARLAGKFTPVDDGIARQLLHRAPAPCAAARRHTGCVLPLADLPHACGRHQSARAAGHDRQRAGRNQP